MKLRRFLHCSVVFSIVAAATILYVTGTLDTPQTANTRKPQPSDELHPSGSDIEKALVTKIPTFTRVSSLSVVSILTAETNQDPGTKVVWQARIKATITVTTDTFTLENEDSKVMFVEPVKLSGETIEVFGNTVAELDAEGWRTTVELEGQPIEALGQPLSAFGPKKSSHVEAPRRNNT
ncbi:MAG: hypothetical protein IPG58_19910 [Acidobacteria bacterium]|nr:hypothetical protein [Acidobacteriota bacterium]